MTKQVWQLILLVIASLALVILVASFQPSQAKTVIGGLSYQLEVVETPTARQIGLSARDFLPADHGMLFVFDDTSYHGIWMKDMNFAIDIIWLDANGVVVDLATQVAPESYPRVWRAQEASKFVIELNAGEVERANLMIGEIVNFNLSTS